MRNLFQQFSAAWSMFLWRQFSMCELCSNTVFLLFGLSVLVLPLSCSIHSFPLSFLSPLHLLWLHVENSVFCECGCERMPRSFPVHVSEGNVALVLCSSGLHVLCSSGHIPNASSRRARRHAAQAAFALEPTSVSHAVVLLSFRSAVVRLSFRFAVVQCSVLTLL